MHIPWQTTECKVRDQRHGPSDHLDVNTVILACYVESQGSSAPDIRGNGVVDNHAQLVGQEVMMKGAVYYTVSHPMP